MTPDEVCDEYSKKKSGLMLRLLAEEEGAPPAVLIEGSSRALRLLADLLLAVANDENSDGFSISPFGAGKFHFSKKSELGVYINRLSQ